jgi:hypothetical protein
VKRGETGETINKKDEITIRGVRQGKWATYITVNSFKYASSAVGHFLWKRGTFNVCLGTNNTERSGTIIEMEAVNHRAETFNAYMSHQAVRKSDWGGSVSVASCATGEGLSAINKGGGMTVTSRRYMLSWI